jgi:hypothetical protein
MRVTGPSIPLVLAEQGATISITGGLTVSIDCDSHSEAREVFAWLAELTASGMSAFGQDPQGLGPEAASPVRDSECAPNPFKSKDSP